MKWLVLLLFVGVALAEQDPEENQGNTDVFEGDMILTAEQKWAAINGLDVDATSRGSDAKGKQWPGGVMAYVIDSSLSQYPEAMAAIRGGMADWTSKTCIRFVKRTNERGYVNFRFGVGCSSILGYVGDRQDIRLAEGCWTNGIVAHEIGHALGFWHEQSRPDRDNYVTIMWNNIYEYKKHNFNKYTKSTIDSLGTKYDYGSLMHYGGTAFSKNWQPTIVAKQSGVVLGQRKGVSAIDAKQMDLLYKNQCSGGGGGGGGGGGSSCKDESKSCAMWKGYCSSNKYVQANCKKTCNLC